MRVSGGAGLAGMKAALVVPALVSPSGGDPRTKSVDSPPRNYNVTPLPPGVPAKIVYPTPLGDFTISDVTDFVKSVSGLVSAKGLLQIPFPSGLTSTKIEHIPIEFHDWTIDAGKAPWRVTIGTVDVPLTFTASVLNFDLKLSKLHMALTGLSLDGSLALTNRTGIELPAGGKFPSWDFAALPVDPAG